MGSVGLDTMPFRIQIPYKRIGNPTGELEVGIRKVVDDSFTLIAGWPVSQTGFPSTGFITINVEGVQDYAMLANDKISLEYPPNATDTISIGTSTTQGNPTGFTCQQYTGSYANTNNPLAISIISKVLVPI